MKELVPVFAALVTATGAVLTAIANKNPTTAAFAIVVLSLLFAVGWLLVFRKPKPKVQPPVEKVQEPGHVKDVEDHPFFQEMMFYVQHEIPKLEIENKRKCFVAKAFLRIKFETFADALKRALADPAFRVEDHVKLLYEMEKSSDELAFLEGIPAAFIDRFDEEFTPIIEIMKDSIASIATSKFLTGQRAKHVAILYQYLAAFHTTIISVENSLNDMNGELDAALDAHFSMAELLVKCDAEANRGK